MEEYPCPHGNADLKHVSALQDGTRSALQQTACGTTDWLREHINRCPVRRPIHVHTMNYTLMLCCKTSNWDDRTQHHADQLGCAMTKQTSCSFDAGHKHTFGKPIPHFLAAIQATLLQIHEHHAGAQTIVKSMLSQSSHRIPILGVHTCVQGHHSSQSGVPTPLCFWRSGGRFSAQAAQSAANSFSSASPSLVKYPPPLHQVSYIASLRSHSLVAFITSICHIYPAFYSW